MDGVAVMVTVSPFPAVDSIVYADATLVSNSEKTENCVEVSVLKINIAAGVPAIVVTTTVLIVHPSVGQGNLNNENSGVEAPSLPPRSKALVDEIGFGRRRDGHCDFDVSEQTM